MLGAHPGLRYYVSRRISGPVLFTLVCTFATAEVDPDWIVCRAWTVHSMNGIKGGVFPS